MRPKGSAKVRPDQPAPENGDDPSRSEFQRFEDLTKRLLAVPKKEIDAERERAEKPRQSPAA